MKPYWKVEVGGVDLTSQFLSATIVRPINAIDYITIICDDRDGRNYIDNVDLFDTLSVYLDWTGGTTKVFGGIIEEVGPSLDMEGGEFLTVKGRGLGRALLLTYNNNTYGVESENPALEDPDEIWTDIIHNYVENAFGVAEPTGYTLTHDINIRPTPNINYLAGAYRSNFDLINEVLQIRQADEGHSGASDQFFIDAAGELHIKAIDESQTDWSHYWDSTTAAPTITEGHSIAFSNFRKTTQDFANKIIYAGQIRKPAIDIWTESTTGWADDDVTLTADTCLDAGEPYIYNLVHGVVVGTKALKAASEIDGTCYFYYNVANAWDFTKIGSAQNIPTLNFFLACTDISDSVQIGVNLYTTRSTHFYSFIDNIDASSRLHKNLSKDLEWQNFSIPIGDYALSYFRSLAETGGTLPYNSKWGSAGSPNWNHIHGIEFQFDGTADRNTIFIDDLHFNGRIVRVAKNSTNITANKEVQKIVVDDTAHDDSMNEADDSGTCALLAKGELMRCQTTPTVGTINFGIGKETMLPGQVLHLHGRGLPNGTFRIDSDFRITKVTHSFNMSGFQTSIDVTSDCLTSFPKTVPEQASIISRYAVMGHKDARNLKTAGIDVLVPFLSVNYPS